jgi:hypothetical protein
MEIKKKSKFGDKKTINTHILNQFKRKKPKLNLARKKKVRSCRCCACRWGSKDSPIL